MGSPKTAGSSKSLLNFSAVKSCRVAGFLKETAHVARPGLGDNYWSEACRFSGSNAQMSSVNMNFEKKAEEQENFVLTESGKSQN